LNILIRQNFFPTVIIYRSILQI